MKKSSNVDGVDMRVTTNLNNITSRQKEIFMESLGEALGILYKSVADRKTNEEIKRFKKG